MSRRLHGRLDGEQVLNARLRCVATILLLVPFVGHAQTPYQRAERFADSVLTRMTLEEKAGQLAQYRGHSGLTGPLVPEGGEADIRAGRVGSFLSVFGAAYTCGLQRIAVNESRSHIPLLFASDVIHGFRTMFPVPLASAASWDPALVQQAARVSAIEATASGLHWTFAPMVDIARDPRWGRVVEGAGEDPYLGAAMAAAQVRGFQGQELSGMIRGDGSPADASRLVPSDVMLATAKHFVAYGAAEGGRDYNVAEVSRPTLSDVYLPPFHAAVVAGTWSVMAAFNEIAGVPMHANRALIHDLLRGQWKWKGLLVSDYTGVMELIPHGVAADSAEAARLALRAGVDVDMVSGIYVSELPRLVRDSVVPLTDVDDAVHRILRAKYALGLFSDPYRFCDTTREKTQQLTPAHRALSRQLARESAVLLKNAPVGGSPVLPLSRSVGSLVVIGALAADARSMIGNWAAEGRASEAITVLDGIRRAAGTARVTYVRGADVTSDTSDIQHAVDAARDADVVVIVAGERENQSAEASSRASIELPGMQEELIRRVSALAKPVVLVLVNGRPLAIPWEAEHIPAILETWYLGSEMGNAVADLLFGDASPSGKLPVSVPRATGQVPIYYNHRNTGRPPSESEKYTSKYLDLPWTPLYPFGHGLSYTTYAYSNLRLSASRMHPRDSIVVSVDVANAGSREGDEVVQLYIQDVVASLTRPVKELRGFQRVTLASGSKRTLSFVLGARDLAFTDHAGRLVIEPGVFRVFVGGSSESVLTGRFVLSSPQCMQWTIPTATPRFAWDAKGVSVPRTAAATCLEKARRPRH